MSKNRNEYTKHFHLDYPFSTVAATKQTPCALLEPSLQLKDQYHFVPNYLTARHPFCKNQTFN